MNHTKLFVRAALFAAITAVSTMVIALPLPGGGYANLGDAAVLLAAFFLPPAYAAAAAGLGAALADVLLSYTVYAPATLVIKAAMAFFTAFIVRRHPKLRPGAVICAELFMVAGYFGYETALYGVSGALPGIPGNAMQGAVCAVAAVVIYYVLSPILKRKEKET